MTGNGAYAKNLYDLFYEGNEPGLDPAGLYSIILKDVGQLSQLQQTYPDHGQMVT